MDFGYKKHLKNKHVLIKVSRLRYNKLLKKLK